MEGSDFHKIDNHTEQLSHDLFQKILHTHIYIYIYIYTHIYVRVKCFETSHVIIVQYDYPFYRYLIPQIKIKLDHVYTCMQIFLEMNHFQAAAGSIRLYRWTRWIKHRQKQDENYTKMLHDVSNKSWKQYPTRQKQYSFIPTIS